jgi:hypothetical protein|tara:strand:- start:2040 stop:3671 length:1632 start_codon:yes stop_codon:yes gene_type:complete
MKINEVDKEITQSDLEALETFADRIFGKVGIDVEFTRHFLDRVNDERNGKQITASELTRLFKQEHKKWGKPIAKMGPDAEAVMKDLSTDINMPFALVWDKENEELDLIVKTVMRKSNFKTSNREFEIEGQSEEAEDCSACNGTGWERVSSDEDERACDDCSGTGKVDELSEWNWRQPFSFPRPDVVGKPLPAKDSYGREDVKTIELPIGLAPGKLNASKKSKKNDKKLNAVKEESQIWKFNKEDPNNPEVMIQGFGSLMLNQIEDSVVGKLEDLVRRAKGGRDWQQIDSLLGGDVLQTMIKAIVDTKKDLEVTRKRGGPKSRGINKDINYESKERTSILDVVGESKIEEFELNEFTLVDVKDMIKKGWMSRPTEKQWKELIKTYNKYKGNVTRKDLLDLGIATLGRKESVKEKQEKKEPLIKGFDPKTARALMMLKTKYPQADNILAALLADVENNEKDGDVTDLSQDYKMDKLTKEVDILQKEINLLKRDKKLNVVKEAGGVGKVVPGVNTSVDVGPNEIKKQAAKFGNAVDKDGVPKKNLR